ncbi:MAG: ROK family protein [Planctomycetaceae bacterium]|nr:ROK family protein [Planctomycetaceae bacterium]
MTTASGPYLGIEIGGTKLQFGVGPADGQTFTDFVRCDVDIPSGAAGIQRQIREVGRSLVQKHRIERVGYGFGGPVFGARGIVQTSHQVSGWDNFPIVEWTEKELGVPTRLGNDCDVAALAEASYGAGRDARSVFYVTVGTGVGGGLVIDRKIHGADRPAAAEIGHLRPGLAAATRHQTVESQAAGPAISERVQHRLQEIRDGGIDDSDAVALLNAVDGQLARLTTRDIAEAAVNGNRLARQSYREATDVLGWAIAQLITLVAPEVVVVGGGVSLAGPDVFFEPLRDAVARYVFPPLATSYRIEPAALGESVVVHGALALAAGG